MLSKRNKRECSKKRSKQVFEVNRKKETTKKKAKKARNEELIKLFRLVDK